MLQKEENTDSVSRITYKFVHGCETRNTLYEGVHVPPRCEHNL